MTKIEIKDRHGKPVIGSVTRDQLPLKIDDGEKKPYYLKEGTKGKRGLFLNQQEK